jgi:hypothetical protein
LIHLIPNADDEPGPRQPFSILIQFTSSVSFSISGKASFDNNLSWNNPEIIYKNKKLPK